MDAIDIINIANPGDKTNFKMGIVADLFVNGAAKIIFDGETIASEKQYAYLSSYKAQKNDRILLASLGGTYVILGKINYNI